MEVNVSFQILRVLSLKKSFMKKDVIYFGLASYIHSLHTSFIQNVSEKANLQKNNSKSALL